MHTFRPVYTICVILQAKIVYCGECGGYSLALMKSGTFRRKFRVALARCDVVNGIW